MQDDAGKTPETPRWEKPYADWSRIFKETPDYDCWPAPIRGWEVCALISRIQHLEGALREAERERDSAIDALTTTQADWSEEREQFAEVETMHRLRLREAEAKAALLDEAVQQHLIDHYHACALNYQRKKCSCSYEAWHQRLNALQ